MTVRARKTSTAAAIEHVYAVRYRTLCRMATTVTGNADSARDAVQEGFARALARAEHFRHDGSLEGWLWRIVFRAALDSRGDRLRVAPGIDEAADQELPLWAPELPHPDRDPELTAALRTLAPRQRLVVFLRFFCDLPHAEIAELTGISLGTVSATLAHAKASLARHLGPRESLAPGKENHG